MEPVILSARDWSARTVFFLGSFAERLRGVSAVPQGASLLLRARSVHGFGLSDPLLLVVVDDGMRVSRVRELRPGAIAWLPEARYVIEMPWGSPAPEVGERIEISRA